MKYLLILITSFLYSQNIYVNRVIDGDTFVSGGFRYRLAEIDAPEINQTFGIESKIYLKKLIENKRVYVDIISYDKYGRRIVKVYLNGDYISEIMVREGFAFQYKRYSSSTTLKRLEQTAKKQRKGIWKYQYIEPQKFRRNGNK